MNQKGRKLTKRERKIYDAILRNFPATDKETAYYHAIDGGIKYNFIYH